MAALKFVLYSLIGHSKEDRLGFSFYPFPNNEKFHLFEENILCPLHTLFVAYTFTVLSSTQDRLCPLLSHGNHVKKNIGEEKLQIIVLSRSQTFDSERSKEAISLEDWNSWQDIRQRLSLTCRLCKDGGREQVLQSLFLCLEITLFWLISCPGNTLMIHFVGVANLSCPLLPPLARSYLCKRHSKTILTTYIMLINN